MTTPELSESEAHALARIEAEPDAPESLRERLIMALADSTACDHVSVRCYHHGEDWPCSAGRAADAVLDVLRGPSTCTTCGEAQAAVERVTALAGELLHPVDYEVTHYRDGLRDAARQVRAALAAR